MSCEKTDRFIALPVGQGDAFFLQRGRRTALIDGGRSQLGFADLFRKHVQKESVDVLVCTHNDADHSSGLIGFLDSGLTCDQVWLPAIWGSISNCVLENPGDSWHELICRILGLDGKSLRKLSRGPGTMLSNLGDDLAAKRLDSAPNDEADRARAGNAVSYPSGHKGGELPWPWGDLSHRLPITGTEDRLALILWFGHPSGGSADLRWQLLQESIDSARRILHILALAIHKGITIRWFEYDPNESSGGESDWLAPINSREVKLISHISPSDILKYLALSQSNKESLVFFSAGTEGISPAALFCADSDLGFSQPIPSEPGMIVTAPHHGSEANARAYGRMPKLITAGRESSWVRSDGRFRGRPGKSFLALNAKKYCTICRGSDLPKQKVEFTGGSGAWSPVKSRPCACI